MREVWGWSLLTSGAVAGFFLVVDTAFFSANVVKILDGGYVPLLLAACVYGIMLTWHKGAAALSRSLHEALIPIPQFMAQLKRRACRVCQELRFFLTRTTRDTPPVMNWHVKRNKALHECLLALNVETQSIPWVIDHDRLTLEEVAPNFWRVTGRYGFMERPDIPALLRKAYDGGCGIGFDDITYYIGHETVVNLDHGHWLARFRGWLFALMERNSSHVADFLRVPSENVVEIGRQVAI